MSLAETPEERARIRSQTLRSMRRPKPAHKHTWTAWEQPGFFDTTARRHCTACDHIQTTTGGRPTQTTTTGPSG